MTCSRVDPLSLFSITMIALFIVLALVLAARPSLASGEPQVLHLDLALPLEAVPDK
ncbi:hypothetical protein LAZ40_04870 [Cereibacter sphaeroides]|uniref:hypothetical protein n=1 Tax=Cereibacter sphaeroides TaxID=1063 RepID=UPI001F1CCEE3|nr:hypothetical protein [Cereibacter sphaeroides]MCE6958389.1 hypothetical protein [Cereibacter sphaeroides]MCE6972256.1 hypothetical protein [Cereibacter sphaeroides]